MGKEAKKKIRKQEHLAQKQQKKDSERKNKLYLATGGIAIILILLAAGLYLYAQPTQATETPVARQAIQSEHAPQQDSEQAKLKAEFFNKYPSLRQLPEKQSALLKLNGNELEVINLSNQEVNIPTIEQTYEYMDSLGQQFAQNNLHYNGVNYTATIPNKKYEQTDIYPVPAANPTEFLILLPRNEQIPHLNTTDTDGATFKQSPTTTFVRIPVSPEDWEKQKDAKIDDQSNTLTIVAIEACQGRIDVFNSQNRTTTTASLTAQEIFCNPSGDNVGLKYEGKTFTQATSFLSGVETGTPGILFNPIPPNEQLYSEIPQMQPLLK